MIFVEGHYYRYTGKKSKPFKNLKCIFSDAHTAVLVPYYVDVLAPGRSFALSQDCKSYEVDAEFTPVTHQINYYNKMICEHEETKTRLLAEIGNQEQVIGLANDMIRRLEK